MGYRICCGLAPPVKILAEEVVKTLENSEGHRKSESGVGARPRRTSLMCVVLLTSKRISGRRPLWSRVSRS